VGSVADERGGPEEDLRVRRSGEEIRAGVREREAGRVSARKSVRSEREVVRVPRRPEEVDIERVPVEGEASGAIEADIGEEEVVVQKKPVAKDEIRVRKDVVHERQIVEEDVRREEVDIEDDTGPRRG
jgi:uncharacterized protein (TIGR02271 family)